MVANVEPTSPANERAPTGQASSARTSSTSAASVEGSASPMMRADTRPSRSSTTVVGTAWIGTAPSRAAIASPRVSSIEGTAPRTCARTPARRPRRRCC
ncbi:hypothetical protein NKG05_06285 [Oerskovia sp. M15]